MKNTDAELYRALVEEYSDTVTRLALIHTGNFADAEDCYQNVFFKLFKELGRREIPNPKAWILKVTLNECRNVLRYRLGKSFVSLSEITAVTEDKHEHEMLDLVFRLPPKYRDALYLYYYEELTIEEISRATKTKVNTVKSQLKRGREKLREFLEDN